jgi:hypothetical protein
MQRFINIMFNVDISVILLPAVLLDKGTFIFSSIAAGPSVTLEIYLQTGKSSFPIEFGSFFALVFLQLRRK